MPAGVTIRSATGADRPRILHLLRGEGLPVEDLDESLAGFLVAEIDGSVVGVAGLERHADHGLLRSVVVARGWRAHRLGGLMIERLLEEADRSGMAGVYLLTTTAEGYFPRFGFARVARDTVAAEVRASSEFRDVCPASAVVMLRPGTPSR
jgi:amino-acid N-acetyltransferase